MTYWNSEFVKELKSKLIHLKSNISIKKISKNDLENLKNEIIESVKST